MEDESGGFGVVFSESLFSGCGVWWLNGFLVAVGNGGGGRGGGGDSRGGCGTEVESGGEIRVPAKREVMGDKEAVMQQRGRGYNRRSRTFSRSRLAVEGC